MRYIDMHCDTISSLCSDTKKFVASTIRENNKMVDLVRLKANDYILQCFAMFIKGPIKNPFLECNKMIDRYYYEINKNRDLIYPAFNYEEIINNKLSSFLTIEDAFVIENDLNNINHFYNRGVRMMSLTWNNENLVASPNYVDIKQPNYKQGLSKFGYDVISRMEEIGMIIDVSHLGDKGFYDVLNNTKRPFVASHSNCRSITKNVRNLTDDMIINMAKRKCLIGINFYKPFLTKKDKVSVDDIINHIKHIKKIGSIDIIALGSDFDGIDSDTLINDVDKIKYLPDMLLDNGFTEDEIKKICYDNFLNFLKNYEKIK